MTREMHAVNFQYPAPIRDRFTNDERRILSKRRIGLPVRAARKQVVAGEAFMNHVG